MNLQALELRILDIDAFRAAMTMKSDDNPKHRGIHVMFNAHGHATEVFNTDLFGIVFVPVETLKVTWNGKPEPYIKLWIGATKIPARLQGVTLSVARDADGNLRGFLLFDDQPDAVIHLAPAGGIAKARQRVPPNLEPLPVAPPFGFDAVHAADVLQAARKAPNRMMPVQLPDSRFAWRWTFENGGEFVMSAYVGDHDQHDRFKRILDAVMEQAPF